MITKAEFRTIKPCGVIKLGTSGTFCALRVGNLERLYFLLEQHIKIWVIIYSYLSETQFINTIHNFKSL